MTSQYAMQVPWFAVIDDTIGGWSISLVDKPVSKLNPVRNPREITIGDFLTEELARYIVELHNRAQGFPEGWGA